MNCEVIGVSANLWQQTFGTEDPYLGALLHELLWDLQELLDLVRHFL